MVLRVKVKPNSRRPELLVDATGQATVRGAAPPRDGQANAALLAFLAEVFGVSKSQVVLRSGHTAPCKTVELVDLAAGEAAAALARYWA